MVWVGLLRGAQVPTHACATPEGLSSENNGGRLTSFHSPQIKMSDYGELSELELLNSQISQLKHVLEGVKQTCTSPDEGMTKIADYVELKGSSDGFMKVDAGMEERNIYHSSVKGAGGNDGGGGCCVAS